MSALPCKIICPSCKKQNLYIKMNARTIKDKLVFSRGCNFCDDIIYIVVSECNVEIRSGIEYKDLEVQS